MSHFEIEIKSLLGEKVNAEALKEKLFALDENCTLQSQNIQLNHYFEGGEIENLFTTVEQLFSGEQHNKFKMIAERGSDFSIRTRQRDDEVLLVIKAAVDEGTSANSVSRMEFEEPVAISLAELDALLEQTGYNYQAKWSREREEYLCKGINVCLDRNAGYGYLAEFEKIVQSEDEVADVRAELDALMTELEVEELGQDRLARMFAHYNTNWPEYYGTDKVFIIE
ncbi:MAG: hypothetical protein RLZZ230_572 [Candidatus Parcubacteria bacterium]|jgi:predicted adenylyl cyclase CyaB